MRIVLDTNVVVSALIWGGTPFKLLLATTDGDLEISRTPGYTRALQYPGFW